MTVCCVFFLRIRSHSLLLRVTAVVCVSRTNLITHFILILLALHHGHLFRSCQWLFYGYLLITVRLEA